MSTQTGPEPRGRLGRYRRAPAPPGTAPTPDRGSSFTVRGVILGILGVQMALAVLLAGRDVVNALPTLLSPSRMPTLDQPIRPGDQTRRFNPADLPGRDRGDPAQRISIPDPGDMPSRLRFDRLDDGVLLLTGAIAPGDAARLNDTLDTVTATTAPTRVRLHSPGGSVSDALAIGTRLRDEGLTTEMMAGDICLSACPYIFAGGITRMAEDGALLGVHQHYFGENTVLPAFLAVEDVQSGQAEVMAHLDALGVDVRVMQHALSTPPDEIYILTREELSEYEVIFDGEDEADG